MEDSPRRKESLRFYLTALLGGAFLLWVWSFNYNLVGNLYDYSIMASGSGDLQAGLHPYADFTTPLQSLSLYAGYAAEKFFGPRYLSLAYANLALMLGFYAGILWTLRNHFSLLLRVLIAVALCSATVLQHGILWYNSIGIVLLTAIAWTSCIWCRGGCQNHRLLVLLCFFLYLTSMTKLNFHALGLAITLGLASLVFVQAPAGQRKGIVWAALGIVFAGMVLGPVTEIILNRTTVHDLYHNILVTPQSRLSQFLRLASPRTYLGKVANNFPDNWCDGIYLKGALIYAGCLWFFFRKPREAAGNSSVTGSFPQWSMLLILPGFYLTALALSVSEDEIQMLTSAFLLAGLVGGFILFGPAMSDTQSAGFKFSIFFLAGFFAIAGSATASLHSRLRWNQPSLMETMMKSVMKAKSFSAIHEVFPVHSAREVDPRLDGYFHNVYFTDTEYRTLNRLFEVMNEMHLNEKSTNIYWGFGLEMMNRVYSQTTPRHLPLWYDHNVTVRESDSDRIVSILKEHDFEWIILAGYFHTMPFGVRNYVTNNYEAYKSTPDDPDLVMFRKKPEAQNAKALTLTQ